MNTILMILALNTTQLPVIDETALNTQATQLVDLQRGGGVPPTTKKKEN